MKLLLSITLICAFSAHAQRGGGMGGGMGGGRGGMGGGMGSSGMGGGMRGGMGSPGMGGGMRGGFGAPGMGHGFGGGPVFRAPAIVGAHGFRGPGNVGAGWGGGWGLGWGWGVGSYGCPYSYPCSSYVTYPYVGGYWPGYSDGAPIQYGYGSQPAVAVVYPPEVERARPVLREYDDTGREVESRALSSASPIYLLAFEDHSILAASSYRVDGATLRYMTLQNEEKQAPLDTLDRALTLQLNRERRVSIRLP